MSKALVTVRSCTLSRSMARPRITRSRVICWTIPSAPLVVISAASSCGPSFSRTKRRRACLATSNVEGERWRSSIVKMIRRPSTTAGVDGEDGGGGSFGFALRPRPVVTQRAGRSAVPMAKWARGCSLPSSSSWKSSRLSPRTGRPSRSSTSTSIWTSSVSMRTKVSSGGG